MRILVTNDDGINSYGINLLVNFAKEYGDVIVVAPKEEQSAKSHSLQIKKGIKVEKVDKFPEVEAYSVDSTPADCVRFAIFGMKDDFDVVFSGINRGFNLGDEILYSGTVGAAMEAVLGGRKAIAFSTDYYTFEGAEKHFHDAVRYILENKLLEKHNLYNVNFPKKSNGVRMTKQGCTHFLAKFTLEEDGYHQTRDTDFSKELDKKDSDVCAILENEISITPLTIDRTKYF